MLLVITFSRKARETLRNARRTHEDAVVRGFGRAALLRETEFGALLALRLRAKHGADVQVERTAPLNEFADVPDRVREAAAAYEDRECPSTPYDRFAAGTSLPAGDELRGREL